MTISYQPLLVCGLLKPHWDKCKALLIAHANCICGRNDWQTSHQVNALPRRLADTASFFLKLTPHKYRKSR